MSAMLKSFVFCFPIFVSFFIYGCEVEGSEVNVSFVEMDVDGRVYEPDPKARIYDDVYGDSPVELVIDDEREGDPYATYLLGSLYISNMYHYGVSQDFDKGRKLLEKSWEMGVADAGYIIFEIYSQGLGVSRNVDLALKYLSASAEMGFILSQYKLAEDYFGRGDVDFIETDYVSAREWFLRAADQGHKQSALGLVYIYHEGLGVEKDDLESFLWVSKLEDMEYGSATFGLDVLADFYENGIGTEVDLVQAYKYYDLQGTAGISEKQRILPLMTPEQVDEAVEMSHDWQIEHNISLPNSEGYRYR